MLIRGVFFFFFNNFEDRVCKSLLSFILDALQMFQKDLIPCKMV